MRISVIGTGYVGLVTAACLADMGNDVIAVDVSQEKITLLRRGRVPIHEPGLAELVAGNLRARRLQFTTCHAEAVRDAEVVFIAVGTPSSEDGSADLRHVIDVASRIGQSLERYTVIVDKSTVPVGTAGLVGSTIRSELDRRAVHVDFDVVSNPEFLKEGAAIADFQRPERIVMGADSARAVDVMRRLYAPFSRLQEKLIVMDSRSAELTKYAANAMLAARISFMNEIAALADALGADIEHVRRGLGSDPRIGPLFLYPGAGFGGSCFPKDLRALCRMAEDAQLPLSLIEAVIAVNERQKHQVCRAIRSYLGADLADSCVAVWGLAFKPGTDDVREAPSLVLIRELVELGARVAAYDPEALVTARTALSGMLTPRQMQRLRFCDSARAAAEDADVLALMTEWKEFRSPDFAWLARALRRQAVFDGRNQYEPQELARHGLFYRGIGRGTAPVHKPHVLARVA